MTRPYAIIPQEGVQVITIEWDENDLVFNGKVQMPAYKVYDENGNDITEQMNVLPLTPLHSQFLRSGSSIIAV